MRAPGILVEAKWTGKKQITVKSDVLEKIVREAVIDSRMPVLCIELNGRMYALTEWDDLLDLHERAHG